MAAALAPGRREVELLGDPQFVGAESVWNLAQWHSRFDLGGTKAEVLASGGVRYFDGAKALVFGGEADLSMEVNGKAEYGERAPEKGAAWAHLLVEQELRAHPMMDAIRAARFRIGYRLTRAVAHRLPGWDDGRHTAQFQFYLTIQNRNRASKGFGDYLWFGVPMYDARYALPPRYAALDFSTPLKKGTGKFIFNPGGERYGEKPLKVGEWAAIDCDLLPLMREGVEAAWRAGFLAGSREWSDYGLAGINLGWEVTGPWDVAMEVRGLGFTAEI